MKLLIFLTIFLSLNIFADEIDSKIERKTSLLEQKVYSELNDLNYSQKQDLDRAIADALRVFILGGGSNGGGSNNSGQCRCNSGDNKLFYMQSNGTEFMVHDYGSPSSCIEGMGSYSVCNSSLTSSCWCTNGDNKLNISQYDGSTFMIHDYGSPSSCFDGLTNKSICTNGPSNKCRCSSGDNKLFLKQYDGSEYMIKDYSSPSSCIDGLESHNSCR